MIRYAGLVIPTKTPAELTFFTGSNYCYWKDHQAYYGLFFLTEARAHYQLEQKHSIEDLIGSNGTYQLESKTLKA